MTNQTCQLICQSCGMPLNNEEDCGKNEDNTVSEYCKYCYQNGWFTNPDMTLEEMVEKLSSFHDQMGLSKEEATNMAKNILPTLERWKENSL